MDERARLGAAAQIEVMREKGKAEQDRREKSKEEELKRRALMDTARKASKYIMHEGKKIRATPIPDKPYNLQQGNEWLALGTSSFSTSLEEDKPTPWSLVKMPDLEAPEVLGMPEYTSNTSRDPFKLSLSDLYKKPLPGTRALGVAAKPRRIKASHCLEKNSSTSEKHFPSIRPDTGSSFDLTSRQSSSDRPFSDTSRLSTKTAPTTIGDEPESSVSLPAIEPAAAIEAQETGDDNSNEPSATTRHNQTLGALGGSGNGADVYADKMTERIAKLMEEYRKTRQGEELSFTFDDELKSTKMSGIMAATWAKKTLRRSRAGAKDEVRLLFRLSYFGASCLLRIHINNLSFAFASIFCFCFYALISPMKTGWIQSHAKAKFPAFGNPTSPTF